ncbi:hypothetical protein GH714_013073 [Hevea brasiliensis]|uniref:Uncharacterized protein n=1 Tax=Hevea brasiliensis TaxID=3981 RepID=A0A6A6NBT8_HEVBR|nr:hypothetical protein GH714_013073 [Hevea brasiliensis]
MEKPHLKPFGSFYASTAQEAKKDQFLAAEPSEKKRKYQHNSDGEKNSGFSTELTLSCETTSSPEDERKESPMHDVPTILMLSDPWKIKKKLTGSDLVTDASAIKIFDIIKYGAKGDEKGDCTLVG